MFLLKFLLKSLTRKTYELLFEFLFDVLLVMIFTYQYDRFHNTLVILNLGEKFSNKLRISSDFAGISLSDGLLILINIILCVTWNITLFIEITFLLCLLWFLIFHIIIQEITWKYDFMLDLTRCCTNVRIISFRWSPFKVNLEKKKRVKYY